MKKLLYVGHSYHNKTQSTNFLIDILSTIYDVEHFPFDPYIDDERIFDQLKGKFFDVVVFFQIIPSNDIIKANINANKFVFFPMYDANGTSSDDFFIQYKDMHFINFSKTIHDRLTKIRLSSFYIQYFPQPAREISLGNIKNLYFWQRVTNVNIKHIEKLFANYNLENIHIHKAIDPKNSFIEPSKNLQEKINITYSTWYEDSQDRLKDLQANALYFAPRIFEGIGMSFLEAMAMGKCVVAPNNPTMNEYITHGKNGILYDHNNIKSLNLTEDEILKIQKNTFEYMQNGYKNWENNKHNILTWIEQPVESKTIYYYDEYIYSILNISLLKTLNTYNKSKYQLFGINIFKTSIKRYYNIEKN